MSIQEDIRELGPLPLDAEMLVQHLDRAYPHQCPRPGESAEAIHRYAGQRSLIDDLIVAYEEDRELRNENP